MPFFTFAQTDVKRNLNNYSTYAIKDKTALSSIIPSYPFYCFAYAEGLKFFAFVVTGPENLVKQKCNQTCVRAPENEQLHNQGPQA